LPTSNRIFATLIERRTRKLTTAGEFLANRVLRASAPHPAARSGRAA
jgi:hypothetical protein